MITPDAAGKAPKKKKAAKPKAAPKTASERVKRPVSGRTGPDRSGSSVKAAAKGKPAPAAAKPAPTHPRHKLDHTVAEAVKSSYDVLSETIAEGRAAAERFRKGQYSVREVPYDVEALAKRLLELARQVSTTTFDICEQLLHQLSLGAKPPPPSTVKPAPSFLDPMPSPGTPGAGDGNPKMVLHVLFEGTDKARSLTDTLSRPQRPAQADHIHALPLMPMHGSAAPLNDVVFMANLMQPGLIAKVKVPARQAKGIYAGAVVVRDERSHHHAPLGMLVIEIGD